MECNLKISLELARVPNSKSASSIFFHNNITSNKSSITQNQLCRWVEHKQIPRTKRNPTKLATTGNIIFRAINFSILNSIELKKKIIRLFPKKKLFFFSFSLLASWQLPHVVRNGIEWGDFSSYFLLLVICLMLVTSLVQFTQRIFRGFFKSVVSWLYWYRYIEWVSADQILDVKISLLW